MNIFKREIKACRRSFIIWTVSLIFLIISGLSEYSAYSKTGGSLEEMLMSMPESLQRLFGFGTLNYELGIHYYGALYLYIALLVTFHSISLGMGIIAKEERDRTAEFLLTKPISRTRILNLKMLAALAMVIVYNLVNLSFTYLMLAYYAKGQSYAKDLILLSLGLLMMQLVFMSFGMLTAAIFGRKKKASAICSGVILTMFMLAIIVDMLPGTDPLKWITVFQYYDAKDILTGEFNILFVVISVVLILGSVTGTYCFYRRRDINV